MHRKNNNIYYRLAFCCSDQRTGLGYFALQVNFIYTSASYKGIAVLFYLTLVCGFFFNVNFASANVLISKIVSSIQTDFSRELKYLVIMKNCMQY